METHLLKIKHLFALSLSSNPNEAAAALAMADKLIAKFGVTPEQLGEIEASDKPIYSDDNLLHESDNLEDWKNLLALVVAQKYDCYAIQENNVARTGDGVTARQTYRYYVYGEDEDVAVARELFSFVYDEMDRIIKARCPTNRGRVYYDSFCEGLVKGVRGNIEEEDFAVVGVVKQTTKPIVKEDAIAPVVNFVARKPPAIRDRAKTTAAPEKEIDFQAFIIGESFGKDIHINRNQRPSFRRFEPKIKMSSDAEALSKALENAFDQSDWGNDYDDGESD